MSPSRFRSHDMCHSVLVMMPNIGAASRGVSLEPRRRQCIGRDRADDARRQGCVRCRGSGGLGGLLLPTLLHWAVALSCCAELWHSAAGFCCCTGLLHWAAAVRCCTLLLHWAVALSCGTGLLHWAAALGCCTGLLHFAFALCCCTGLLHWAAALGCCTLLFHFAAALGCNIFVVKTYSLS